MKKLDHSVKFLIATFTLTYTSWISFMLVHYSYGIKVFDNSPFGLLMLLGLFSPSIMGLIFRLRYGSLSSKTTNQRTLYYSILAFLLPVGLVLTDTLPPQLLRAVIANRALPEWPELHFSLSLVVSAFAMSIVFGGLEELGWRAYLLPQLLQKYSLVKSTLILAFFWSIWHLPLFFLPGAAQYQDNFIIFSLSLLSLSCIMSFLWIKTQSLLIAIISHAAYNTMAALNFESANNLTQLLISLTIALLSLVMLSKISDQAL